MSGSADSSDRSLVRRLWWLWTPVVLLMLGVLAYASTRTSLLDVDRIEVEGAGLKVTERAVLEAAAIEVGRPLLDLDLDAELIREVPQTAQEAAASAAAIPAAKTVGTAMD